MLSGGGNAASILAKLGHACIAYDVYSAASVLAKLGHVCIVHDDSRNPAAVFARWSAHCWAGGSGLEADIKYEDSCNAKCDGDD